MPDDQKTAQELRAELELTRTLKDERKISDDSYARKIFENAVIWVAVIICGLVISSLVGIAVKSLIHTDSVTQSE